MEYTVTAKYVRMSPRKASIVANLVRGKECRDAQSILKFTPNKPARYILRALNSAIANAADRSNGETSVDDLMVKHISIDGGPMLKRMRAGTRGRGFLIRKRMSHINITVAVKAQTE